MRKKIISRITEIQSITPYLKVHAKEINNQRILAPATLKNKTLSLFSLVKLIPLYFSSFNHYIHLRFIITSVQDIRLQLVVENCKDLMLNLVLVMTAGVENIKLF